METTETPKVKRRRRTKWELVKGIPLHPRPIKKGRPELINSIPKTKIIKAYFKYYGIMTKVAESLGCSLANISIRTKQDKDLQEARKLAEEIYFDRIQYNFYEDVLRSVKNINAENWQRIKFMLKTKMRDRGFGEEPRIPRDQIPVEIIPAKIEEAEIVEETKEEDE